LSSFGLVERLGRRGLSAVFFTIITPRASIFVLGVVCPFFELVISLIPERVGPVSFNRLQRKM
jgi:hypothetical protein